MKTSWLLGVGLVAAFYLALTVAYLSGYDKGYDTGYSNGVYTTSGDSDAECPTGACIP